MFNFDGLQAIGLAFLALSSGIPTYFYLKKRLPNQIKDLHVGKPAPLRDVIFHPEPVTIVQVERPDEFYRFQVVVESLGYSKNKLQLNIFLTNIEPTQIHIKCLYIWYVPHDGKFSINWFYRRSIFLKPNESRFLPNFLSYEDSSFTPLAQPLGRLYFSTTPEYAEAELNLAEYFL